MLKVLQDRAAQLSEQGDRVLQLEIERAMWLVAAHEHRQRVQELETVEEEEEDNG